MSAVVEGLIETSCNLASVKMKPENRIEITAHTRSAVDSRRDEICNRIKALYQLIGCDVIFSDAYVGWAPNKDSKVLKIAEQSFKDCLVANRVWRLFTPVWNVASSWRRCRIST